MNLKPRKLNTILGVLAFLIIFIATGLQFCRAVSTDSCTSFLITPEFVLISIIIGIIVYFLASFFVKVK